MYASNNSVILLTLSFLYLIKLLDVDPQDQGEEDGAVVDLDSQRKGKCAVIKTSTRQVIHAHFPPDFDLSCTAVFPKVWYVYHWWYAKGF
jgi:hypothetical protein